MSEGGEVRPASGEAAPSAGRNRPATEGTPKPQPRRRPGDKPFIPFARFEEIVVRCGHTEQFGLLPEGKDRFREDRRKKAISRDCKACRQSKQRQQEEATLLRRAQKEKRKEEEAQRLAALKEAPHPQDGRLPDGSRFEVGYNAAEQRWSGSLTIPIPAGEAVTFTGSGSALFPLLKSLDRQYRATLHEPPQDL